MSAATDGTAIVQAVRARLDHDVEREAQILAGVICDTVQVTCLATDAIGVIALLVATTDNPDETLAEILDCLREGR